MEISKRLEIVAKMVTKGNVVADIGTDHGYVPIYLVKELGCPHVIAMDVAKGPLSKARENIAAHCVSDKIETRLSNGLSKLAEYEADTVIIAGMGGQLIMNILQEGKKVLETVEEIILSPQTEIAKVRHFLAENGYIIHEEEMFNDDGKTYVVFKLKHGKPEKISELFARYGKKLLENRNEELLTCLLKEKEVSENLICQLKKAQGGNTAERIKQLQQDLVLIEEGLKYYDM